MVYLIDFFLDFEKDPRHASHVSNIIVEPENLAFKNLSLVRVEVNIFFWKSIIIVSVDFDDKFVPGRG